MSAGALICTGNSILECDLNSWPEDQDFEIGLTLQVADAGTYIVNAKVSSANDTDASNNESSHGIEMRTFAARDTARDTALHRPTRRPRAVVVVAA